MKKINLKTLSGTELLDLQESIKKELSSRFSVVLLEYMRRYDEKNKDRFGIIDQSKLENDVLRDLGVDKETFWNGIKALGCQKLMYVSVIPGRELKMLKLYFQG